LSLQFKELSRKGHLWSSDFAELGPWKVLRPQIGLLFLLLLLLILLLLLLLLTAVQLSFSGSSPYTRTDKTNKNKYT